MTRTEERLSVALAARADAVLEDGLRPLRVPSARPRRRPRLLVALAGAVSVLVAIGIATGVVHVLQSSQPFADVAKAGSPPPYYVTVDSNDTIVVHSTATGQITAMASNPYPSSGGSHTDAAITANATGRVFVAAFNDEQDHRTRLLRFGLTGSGHISGLASVPSRPVPGLTVISTAVSRSGWLVAIAGVPYTGADDRASLGPPELVVVNLRTGQQRTWRGPPHSGAQDLIQDPTWTADGKSVQFLMTRCPSWRGLPLNASCQGPRAPLPGQEWAAHVPTGHGQMSAHPIATLPAWTAQALIDPGGRTITALTLGRDSVTVARYAIPSGRKVVTLARWRANFFSAGYYETLATDSTSRYMFVDEGDGSVFGWIDHGIVRSLSDVSEHGNRWATSVAW